MPHEGDRVESPLGSLPGQALGLVALVVFSFVYCFECVVVSRIEGTTGPMWLQESALQLLSKTPRLDPSWELAERANLALHTLLPLSALALVLLPRRVQLWPVIAALTGTGAIASVLMQAVPVVQYGPLVLGIVAGSAFALRPATGRIIARTMAVGTWVYAPCADMGHHACTGARILGFVFAAALWLETRSRLQDADRADGGPVEGAEGVEGAQGARGSTKHATRARHPTS